MSVTRVGVRLANSDYHDLVKGNGCASTAKVGERNSHLARRLGYHDGCSSPAASCGCALCKNPWSARRPGGPIAQASAFTAMRVAVARTDGPSDVAVLVSAGGFHELAIPRGAGVAVLDSMPY